MTELSLRLPSLPSLVILCQGAAGGILCRSIPPELRVGWGLGDARLYDLSHVDGVPVSNLYAQAPQQGGG